MIVMVWSDNRILADLIARNLVRRGFEVRERSLPYADAPRHDEPDTSEAALAVVNLDCDEPELWRRATRVRSTMPDVPLVILGHAWPAAAQLERLQPCTYVRKPFAIDELLAAVQAAPAGDEARQ